VNLNLHVIANLPFIPTILTRNPEAGVAISFDMHQMDMMRHLDPETSGRYLPGRFLEIIFL